MKLLFQRKAQESDDAWSFWFLPQQPVNWIAGQSLRLEIPAGYDTDERRFSIASAPYEGAIRITTKLSHSDFKRGLQALAPGAVVDAYAIEGHVIWGATEQPRLFLAAGIGITPFRAILLDRSHNDSLNNTALVYASTGPHLFHPELRQLRENGLDIRFVAGRFGRETLEQLPIAPRTLVYISGPSGMVQTVAREIIQLYQLPEAQLLRDHFTGGAVNMLL